MTRQPRVRTAHIYDEPRVESAAITALAGLLLTSYDTGRRTGATVVQGQGLPGSALDEPRPAGEHHAHRSDRGRSVSSASSLKVGQCPPRC